MRNDLHKRLLRFMAVEVLLQAGFERSSGQALAICTDLLVKFLESLLLRYSAIQEVPPVLAVRHLLATFYGESSYQYAELHQFTIQQVAIQRQLRDKDSASENGSLLHLLRILPPGTSLRCAARANKQIIIEEERDALQIADEIDVDDFFKEFVATASADGKHKALAESSVNSSSQAEQQETPTVDSPPQGSLTEELFESILEDAPVIPESLQV